MDHQSHILGQQKIKFTVTTNVDLTLNTGGTAETRKIVLVLDEEHAIATSGDAENGRPETPHLAQETVLRSPTNADLLKILETALKQGSVTAR
jgi:hypothetical protein